MNYENFNQLNETTLSDINGGSVVTVIAVAGGIICAANEVHKFSQGVVNGWNKYIKFIYKIIN